MNYYGDMMLIVAIRALCGMKIVFILGLKQHLLLGKIGLENLLKNSKPKLLTKEALF